MLILVSISTLLLILVVDPVITSVAKQLNVSQYGELDDKKLLTLIGVS
jgi:hypothetical protein